MTKYRYLALAATLGLLVLANPTDAQFQPMPTVIYDQTTGAPIPLSDGGVGVSTADTTRVVQAQTTPLQNLDVDETEDAIKATAGELCGVWVTNRAATTRWLKFYNATVATVVVGTTTPLITIGIAGNATDNITGQLNTSGGCAAFDTAITVAATTGFAVTDTGAPGVNDVIITSFFR